jgi:hypothetical protein
MRPIRLTGILLLAVASACSDEPPAKAADPAPAAPVTVGPTTDTELAIAGATNSNVSLAAHGSEVVAVWAATVGEATNIYAAVSHDAGATFATPVRVNDHDGDARVSGEQAPRVALGTDVVVAWTSKIDGHSLVRMARSTTGGTSFQPTTTLHALTLTGARGWVSVAIDDAGAVHAVWLDGRDAMAGMTHPAGAAVSHDMHGGMRQDVFEATWRADGTHTETRLATNVCFCCKTSVSVGPRGSVFAAWRNIYPTNLRDMAVATSSDAGQTFRAPVRVSEDHWQLDACPEDGPSTTVTADGVVHIVWPTLIGETTPRKAIFYSESTDGGKTFAPRARVDDDNPASGSAHPQMVARPDGVVIVWDEVVDGHRAVRTRDRVTTGASAFGSIATASGSAPATYPAVATTTEGSVIAWTTASGNGSRIVVRRAK